MTNDKERERQIANFVDLETTRSQFFSLIFKIMLDKVVLLFYPVT